MNDIKFDPKTETISLEGYRIIGRGTSRLVFADKINTHVIKVCSKQFSENPNANKFEVDLIKEFGNDLWFLPKLLGYSNNYKFIAFEFCKKIKKISNLKFQDNTIPKTFREIETKIFEEAKKLGILLCDCCSYNILERNRTPVLCDFEFFCNI